MSRLWCTFLCTCNFTYVGVCNLIIVSRKTQIAGWQLVFAHHNGHGTTQPLFVCFELHRTSAQSLVGIILPG